MIGAITDQNHASLFSEKPASLFSENTASLISDFRALLISDHNIKLEDRFLRVTDTKNGEERTVPIFDPLYYRLKAWKRLMGNPDSGLVFLHPRSGNHHTFPLPEDHVSKIFKKHALKAGFKKTINFHGLRHSCATFLLRKRFNVIQVKNMLGHKSIEVTNKYVHLVANDLLATASRNGLISS